ncbi:MAG: hypothetical protein IBX50_08000 [Marinospirillum sp.]|uniref:hypothetical protein n=1 Tax=Marinospirillum sp. TaxID=2183934 RepID=UPI0019E4962F|nr:hypothetical protein [Marinospirillum sp.]MBE0506648.1 hypothetical protein [Marinospirillum sp.]
MSSIIRRFDLLQVGQMSSVKRCYQPNELAEWQSLSGWQGPLVTLPEPLIAALFSYLLGVRLPGAGTMYLKQSMVFEYLVRPDEPVQASVMITQLRPGKSLVNLDTVCTDAAGRTICQGKALVLFKC